MTNDIIEIKVTLTNGTVVRVKRDYEDERYWEFHWQDSAEEAFQNENSISARSKMRGGAYGWRGGYESFEGALADGLDDASVSFA